ncbi:MAG TPA: zinc ribbon domain-containing protein [Dehalococcoidia bacterium]|nr:zinc ribbon domain-containing protein [Dehalococcoidia bacterium]
MFCPGCGTNNEDGARFCYRCGRRLSDGSSDQPQTGPAWKDFVEAVPDPVPVEVINAPIPEPVPVPPLPISPQIIVGRPKRDLPLGMIAGIVLAIGAVVGGIAGVFYAVQSVDKDSLPVIGKDNTPQPAGTQAPAILASLSSTCQDTNKQPCNLIWDITAVEAQPDGLRIDYTTRATGQVACNVAIQADQALTSSLENTGRPGPYLEGARGRYYPLRTSEGLTSAGGNLACGASQNGTWHFAPVTGETFVKLRYPGLPSARIDLLPIAVSQLPPPDPPAVVAVQQTTCQTVQGQPCNGLWEIGPYGIGNDGAPIVFFAMRFDGPANCTINWQSDVAANQALVASGTRGIGLELANNTGFLPITAGGGVSIQAGPLNCATVLTGFWRFTAGNVTSNVNMIYPDFPPAQLQLKP